MKQQTTTAKQSKGRWALLALLVLFFLSVSVANTAGVPFATDAMAQAGAVINVKENTNAANNGTSEGFGTFILDQSLWPQELHKDVAMEDLDGDGDLDLVFAIDGGNKVWLNDGSGQFSTNGQSLGNSNSRTVALGDVDGDSDLDLFVANGLKDEIQANKVWLNDGAGNFTDSGQSLGNSHSEDVALADIDGDSDLDAFVVNGGTDNFANKVWLNDGTGHFTDSNQNLGDLLSWAVALSDVDGDSDLDAFVGNEGANKVWLNNGSGVFTDSLQSLSNVKSLDVALGDVDGDSDVDAFVVNIGPSAVGEANKVWINQGGIQGGALGVFSDSGQSLENLPSRSVALGDLDGDGSLDAYVGNWSVTVNGREIWLNDGLGNFTANGQSLKLGGNPGGIAIGDVDSDGDLDVVEATHRAPSHIWHNEQAVLFVDQAATSGNNDGTSWDDAHTDLQDALAVANFGHEIWVAAGTYKPTNGTDRSISFQLKNGVALYGGFDGTETAREERDWEANPTILSGDLNEDDNDNVAHDEPTRAENSLHVVLSNRNDSTARLSGFTITGGNANGDNTNDISGGGMINLRSHPTVSHVTFLKNSAAYTGGGMHNFEGAPLITYATFENNSADEGGGMLNNSNVDAEISHSVFTNNRAKNGGGLSNQTSNPILTDVTFSYNSAVGDLPSNGLGGGMLNNNSQPTLNGVTFIENSATMFAGGLYNTVTSSPYVSNAVFMGNSAAVGGAIFNNNGSLLSLVNVMIAGNLALYDGGGLVNWATGTSSLSHVTITGNLANQNGGGIYGQSNTSVTISNSILWNNQDSGGTDASAQIDYETGATSTVTYSIVQGGFTGTGNIDADPLFISPINPNNAPTTAGDFHLEPTSPAIDAGDNSAVPTDTLDLDGDLDISEPIPFDLDGFLRFRDTPITDTGNGIAPIVDMGAYEKGLILYVDGDATGANDGTSWGNAFTDLQDGFRNVTAGDEIWVAAGTYKPTPDSDRTKSFHLKNGVSLYGGFDGTETSRQQRDWEANPTILSGDLNADDNDNINTAEPTRAENSLNVVIGHGTDSSALLDGFTITGGNSNEGTPDGDGGGMYIWYGSPTLQNLAFMGNSADDGGGLATEGGHPTLTNVTFSNNFANDDGGGLSNHHGNLNLENVSFINNSAQGDGGGMFNFSADPIIRNSSFTDNLANVGGGIANQNNSLPTISDTTFTGNSASYGGGMYNLTSSPTLNHVTFIGNLASEEGGGMRNSNNSNPILSDVTFENNSAVLVGGGMANQINSSPTISDATFTGNSATHGGGMHNEINSSPLISNSTFTGNSATQGGGGMNNWSPDSVPLISHVTFTNNSASFGGGMFNAESNPRLDHVIFTGNSAVDDGGGGMCNHNNKSTLINVTFIGNSAPYGGGMYNLNNTSTLSNVTFTGNSAQVGGGMRNSNSNPTISHATFTGNLASSDGGGIANTNDSHPLLTNSILWNNKDSRQTIAISQIYGGSPSVNYSLVQGGWITGTGNIDTDPLFISPINPADAPTTAGDFHLEPTSPAIDAGDNSAVPTDTLDLDGDLDISEPLPFDLDGFPRFRDTPQSDTGNGSAPIVDMGAYEKGLILYVDADAVGGNNGTSWVDAYTDLQDALAAATAGDEIWVAAGTYKPTNGTDRSISFQLKNGVGVYGGFDGTETARQERDWEASVTILSGDLSDDDNYNVDPDELSRAENSYNVVESINHDSSAILDGFTITGGNANNTELSFCSHSCGGGMYNFGSSPTINQVIFRDNSARFGGGMYNNNNAPVLSHVTFSGNVASEHGGAMRNSLNSHAIISHAMFENNSADQWGGAISNYDNSQLNISETIFRGNSAAYGGGMHNLSSSPQLSHVTFIGNSATEQAGGMRNANSNPILSDVTFEQNSAPLGGGMNNWNNSSPTLNDVTFSNNEAEDDGAGMYNTNSHPTLTHVTFIGNSANGAGNQMSDDGGGMFNNNSHPTLNHVLFKANSANGFGGGMMNRANSNPLLHDVIFVNNSTADDGGGMYNSESSPQLYNVSFIGNSADGAGSHLSDDGGGMANVSNSAPILVNVHFGGNWANGVGGGIANYSSSATLNHVTFSGNASQIGGAISNYESQATISNSILWNNKDVNGTGATSQISNRNNSTVSVSYTLVEGSWAGEGNIDADPLFVNPINPDYAPTMAGNLHLRSISPAIDAGNNLAVFSDTLDLDGDGNTSEPIPFDLDGQARFFDSLVADTGNGTAPIVDMGAYEDSEATFRTFDGTQNNPNNPALGSTDSQLLRTWMSPATETAIDTSSDYGDGISTPAGAERPSAREVSNAVAAQSELGPNAINASDYLWQWGQFIDHDLDLTEPISPTQPFNITVPLGDPFFDPFSTGTAEIALNRSIFDLSTGIDSDNPRQQINEITAWIDASQVYGSDLVRASWKRSFVDGKLRTSAGDLLPFEDSPTIEFAAGDIRANEQIGLTAMHTLFMREHNRLADLIAAANPGMSDEELFQRARALVGAEMQMITYNEFLPLLLGQNALPAYTGYNEQVNPNISNIFSTAAFRFGHTMLSPTLLRLDENGNEIANGHVALRDAFFNPQFIIDDGITPILRGLGSQRAQAVDTLLIDDVRNFLFGPPGSGGFDLAALNIQRGRDHGLPSYNAVREAFGLGAVTSFAEITSDVALQTALAQVYYDDVNKVDLWVGGLAEDAVAGTLLGPTFRAILIDQFTRLRDGDRFWHQNVDWSSYGFATDPQLHSAGTSLSQVNLSDIIGWNTEITEIQENVFLIPELQVEKTVDSQVVQPEDTLTYEILVTASGGNLSITLTDTLPAGLTYLPGTVTGGATFSNGEIRYEGPVSSGDPLLISYQATVDTDLAAGSMLYNAVLVTSENRVVEDAVTVVTEDTSVEHTLALLYVNGDNDISQHTLALLNKAERAAGNQHITVLVLLDGPGDGDAYLYRLEEDFNLGCPNYINPTCNGRYVMGQNLWEWDENIASPYSLSEFLIGAVSAYPNTDQIVLSMVGHGGGWAPTLLDGQPMGHTGLSGGPGGLLWDNHYGTSLSTAELAQGLSWFHQSTGRKVDLLYLDACLMAMSEVAYEVRDSVRYLLASESWNWTSFSYDAHLNAITSTTNARQIGEAWLANEASVLREDDYPFTFSLIDLRHITNVRQALDNLASELIAVQASQKAKIEAAFLASACFDSDGNGRIVKANNNPNDLPLDYYCDLHTFAEQLKSEFSDQSEIVTAAQGLQNAVAAAVITSDQHDGIPWQYSTQRWTWEPLGGLSGYLPFIEDDSRRRYYTGQHLAFAQDGQWDEFIHAYWNNADPPPDPECPPEGCDLPPGPLPIASIALQTLAGQDSIMLEWMPEAPLSDLDHYDIYRSADDGQSYTVIGTTSNSQYTDNDPSLTPETEYCYQVKAVDSNDNVIEDSNVSCVIFGTLSLWIPNQVAAPGATNVQIPINVANGNGLCVGALAITISYDETIVTATGAVEPTIYSQGYEFVANTDSLGEVVIVATTDPDDCTDLYGGGALFIVGFDIIGHEEEISPLDFITELDGTVIYDDNLDLVQLALQDGSLTVRQLFTRGDIDGDGDVDVRDAALALRISSGRITPTAAQQAACDVNNDMQCNQADASLIRCYAAHQDWDVCGGSQSLNMALPGGNQNSDASRQAQTQPVEVAIGEMESLSGPTIRVPIVITNATDFAGGDLLLLYNPEQMMATGAFTTSLTSDFLLESYIDSPGMLHLALASGSPIGTDGTIVELEFTLITGVSSIKFGSVHLNDASGRDFVTSALQREIELLPYQPPANIQLVRTSLEIGWNNISLPLLPIGTSLTASDVCLDINAQGGNAVEIDRWHAAGWDGHICGEPFNDFDLVLGANYFIKSSTASSWTIVGYKVTEAVPLELQAGWTSIGIPHTDAYSAESLCNDIISQGVTAVEIDRWHLGGWNGHICGLPFNDFNIESGVGYFIKSTSAGTVTPSEAPTSLQLPEAKEAHQAVLSSEMPTGKALPVRDLRISNLNDSSVTLSWLTDEATTGYVLYGENQELGQVALDVRGGSLSAETHFVVLTDLKPETSYHFKVVSGAEGDGEGDGDTLQSITTASTLESLPASDTVYGQVYMADGITPATGALVYLTLQDADGAGDTGEATLLSALTDENGHWHANLGNARLADGGLFNYSVSEDDLLIDVPGAGSTLKVDTAHDAPAPLIYLANQPTSITVATFSASASWLALLPLTLTMLTLALALYTWRRQR